MSASSLWLVPHKISVLVWPHLTNGRHDAFWQDKPLPLAQVSVSFECVRSISSLSPYVIFVLVVLYIVVVHHCIQEDIFQLCLEERHSTAMHAHFHLVYFTVLCALHRPCDVQGPITGCNPRISHTSAFIVPFRDLHALLIIDDVHTAGHRRTVTLA